MPLKLTFSKYYFTLAVLLFIIEVVIALYVHDAIVRPYIGDFLVVILLYCFEKAIINFPVLPTATCVLLFAYLIEFLQYLQLVKLLGLQHNTFARIVIGTSFEWGDILVYTFGIGLVVAVEKLIGYLPTHKQVTNI